MSGRSLVGTLRAVKFPWWLLVAGLVLLLTNLGNIYLWQDEAETALLSQRLGTYGLPLAFDGRNLIRQAPMDIQYTADYVWVYHPWLPFYWTALSFKLLGPTTFAARLPYALAGLGTVLLLYYSVRRHFRDQRLATLSSTLLLLCIPFLLHARQCKYFPFAALFTVAALDAYLRLLRPQHAAESRLALPYFILAGFFLFQSNFGAFLPLFAALGLHFLLTPKSLAEKRRETRSAGYGRVAPTRPSWSLIKRMALAVAAVGLFVAPWAVYLQTWARGRFVFDIYRFAGHLVHYVVYITGWVLPWPLLLFFAYLYWIRRKNSGLDRERVSTLNLYILVTIITLLFLSATFIWMYFSYIVQLVPLLTVILALTILRIADRSRVLGYALLVLLVATNVLHVFPYALPLARSFKWASLAPRRYLAETDELIATAGRLRSSLVDYAYELTHDYDGPDEGIVLYLREHAAPGDVVLTNYGELPVAFYTGLHIAGGLGTFRLEEVTSPEWIINRPDGPYSDELARIISEGHYTAITISYPEILWGNRPVPEYHKFATVHDVPDVVIHRRAD